jgi:hypothetical protein
MANKLDLSGALAAQAQVTTADPPADTGAAGEPLEKVRIDKTQDKPQMIAVRVNETDYRRLKVLFAGQGLALARAANLALYYVAEQMEAGRISVTKAGIIDRRG